MSLDMFYLIYAGVLGLLVGSFLNVVILRLPPYLMWQWKHEAHEFLDTPFDDTRPPGLVVKRSFCPHCQHQLAWWENIPLVSYLLLRGKCRSCAAKISWQYPLVEFSMSLLAVACVYLYGWTFTGLAAAALCAVLVVGTGIDFRTQFLPDEITLPPLWAALLLSLTPYGFVSPTLSILGASIGYLSLWSLFWLFKLLRGKEGMGYGDFKLLALLGAAFGPQSLIPILLVAAFTGAIVGFILLKIRKESLPFAFGPYLALGGITYLFAGQQINAALFAL